MLTKSQFLQALRDNPIVENADPYGTIDNLSEGTANVRYTTKTTDGVTWISAELSVELESPKVKGKKGTSTEEDGPDYGCYLCQTGISPLTSLSMVEVEKAQQNAIRNAIALMGGIVEYIPVAQAVDPVVKRPMATAAAPTNGVIQQAAAVAAAASGSGPVCADCGKVLTEIVPGKFGDMDPQAYAAWTTKKMGRVLCKTCNGKAYAKQQGR